MGRKGDGDIETGGVSPRSSLWGILSRGAAKDRIAKAEARKAQVKRAQRARGVRGRSTEDVERSSWRRFLW